MEGVPEMIPEIQIEATFPTAPSWYRASSDPMIPGEMKVAAGHRAQCKRKTLTVQVTNTGDRPVQSARTTTSRPTRRCSSTARRPTAAASTSPRAPRFEPGQTRTVELVAVSGSRIIFGFNGKVMGKLK
jgi:urease beta subunit